LLSNYYYHIILENTKGVSVIRYKIENEVTLNPASDIPGVPKNGTPVLI